jgi:UDP-2-acetamido-3-amino-2,3-dideoxy-glucuronate N-acetyltransferase
VPPRTDGWEGLRVLEVLNAAEQSLRKSGRTVALPPSGNGRKAHVAPVRALATAAVGAERNRGFEDSRNRAAESSGPPEARPLSGVAKSEPRPSTPASASIAPHFYAHPTAIVDEDATVGNGTKIWHYSHVSAGARIGPNNVFGQNVFVAPGVVTGAGCKVQNNVSLYKGVRLEDDVFCGPSCVFTNVIDPRAFVEKKAEFKDTLVRQGASIGANATVVCGNTLGRYCLIGSGAVVTHDVPGYALMTGVPARQQGWVCKCGARLVNDDGRARCRCGNEYRLGSRGLEPTKEKQ